MTPLIAAAADSRCLSKIGQPYSYCCCRCRAKATSSSSTFTLHRKSSTIRRTKRVAIFGHSKHHFCLSGNAQKEKQDCFSPPDIQSPLCDVPSCKHWHFEAHYLEKGRKPIMYVNQGIRALLLVLVLSLFDTIPVSNVVAFAENICEIYSRKQSWSVRRGETLQN